MTFPDLPTPVLVLLGVLIVVQIVLEVWALIVLFKTPDDRLLLGKKWPWVLIILLVNTIGAVIFLAAGRTKPPVDDRADGAQPAVPTGDAAARAVDVLYGEERAAPPAAPGTTSSAVASASPTAEAAESDGEPHS